MRKVQSTKSSDAAVAVAEISLSVKETEETPDDERSTHYKSQPMAACEEMQVDLPRRSQNFIVPNF